MNESRSKLLWNSTIKHVIQFPSCTLCEHSFGSVQYEWVVGRPYLQVHWGTQAQHCSPSIPRSWGQSQSGDLLAVDSLRGSLSHGAHHHCCAPCGDHGVLRCALCGELLLLEIEAGGHFRATQGQLPPSKGRLACPWSFCQKKTSKQSMITPIQLHETAMTWSSGQGRSWTELVRSLWVDRDLWYSAAGAALQLPLPACASMLLGFSTFWAFWADTNAFSGLQQMPKNKFPLFQACWPPRGRGGGVSKRLERVLWLLWLIDKGSQGPWGTRGDTARHPTSRRSLMEMSLLQIFSGVVSTNFVAEMLEMF